MTVTRTGCVLAGLLLSWQGVSGAAQAAQTPAPAAATAAASRQIGTIQTLDATSLVLVTDKRETVSVSLTGETKVVQLAAGSTDLKTAQPGAMTDLAVGDRVLAIGSSTDTPGTLIARRLVLMKSTDIAKRHEAEQAGWQHGSGGIVTAVDATTGVIMVSAGARTLTVVTHPSTIIRRYAPNSARFEDATKSSLAELHVGDQLRVRGERASVAASTGSSVPMGGSGPSGDPSRTVEINAEEIVSGSFRHLSGTVQTLNAAAGQLTVLDAKTKLPTVVSVSSGTAIHELPPEVASRFAARSKVSGATSAGAAAPPRSTGGSDGSGSPGSRSGGGGDLAQIVSQLPALTLADLKVGEAVMAVGGDGTAGAVSAITILGGVEPILAASPKGGAEMALSPWSMGGGGDTAGGSQ